MAKQAPEEALRIKTKEWLRGWRGSVFTESPPLLISKKLWTAKPHQPARRNSRANGHMRLFGSFARIWAEERLILLAKRGFREKRRLCFVFKQGAFSDAPDGTTNFNIFFLDVMAIMQFDTPCHHPPPPSRTVSNQG